MKEKILIIDDDTTLMFVTGKILRNLNYEVIEAYNGKEGISKIDSTEIDLILLDIVLPDMSGQDIAKYIRGKNKLKHIPIIYFTGMEKVDEVQSLITYADDFIRKPVDPKLLSVRITVALRMSSYRKELEEIMKFGVGKIVFAVMVMIIVLTAAFLSTMHIFSKTPIINFTQVSLKEIIPHFNTILLGEGLIFVLVIGIAYTLIYLSVSTRLKKAEELLDKV